MPLFFKNERDSDFYNVCEDIRRAYGGEYISTSDIARLAVRSQAKSFYISYCRCYNIIRLIKNGERLESRSKAKTSLFEEIKRRYLQIKEEKQALKDSDIVCMIIKEEAPRFYITDISAKILYYKLLKTMK